MNSTRICFTTALLLSWITTAVAQTTSPVSIANGAFAQTEFCANSGSTFYCIFAFVSRAGSGSTQTTFLTYDFFASDSTLNVFVDYSGFGQIPNSAFQVQGPTDSLNVNTSTVPGFTNSFCNTSACGTASGGPVSGTWIQLTPQVGTDISGTETFSSPGAKFIFSGTQDYNLASTSVSVLGEAASNTQGIAGTQHNTSIFVQSGRQ